MIGTRTLAHGPAGTESTDSPRTDDLVRPTKRRLIALRRQGETLALAAVKTAGLISGTHLSRLKGRGMELDEVRPYQPGDDIRSLDWRVIARTGKPYTKLFREERERSVIFWVDYRAPMWFGTRTAFKSVLAAQAAAMLAWSARQHGDHVGGLIFSEQRHRELRPLPGPKAVLTLIQELADHPAGPRAETDAGAQNHAGVRALSRLKRVTHPGSMLFLISDFLNTEQELESHLPDLARHNDVVLLFLFDPLERELPPPGRYRVSDGRRRLVVDTSDRLARDKHRQRFERRILNLRRVCRRHRISLMEIATDQPLRGALAKGLAGTPR